MCNGAGCIGDGGSGIVLSEGCSCQVNIIIMECTLEGVQVVGDKYIRWKAVPLWYCSGEKAVSAVVAVEVDICLCLCGWMDLVWQCLGLKY